MQDAMFVCSLLAPSRQSIAANFIANNLANVNTHGYKGQTLASRDTMASYAHDEIREPLMNLRSKLLFSGTQKHGQAQNLLPFPERIIPQGTMEFTGNALDRGNSG